MITTDKQDVFKQQTGGTHYQGLTITPVEYAMKNKLDACQFSVVKYITRFREKNGLQDLQKAKDFIDMLINSEYADKKDVLEQTPSGFLKGVLLFEPKTKMPEVNRNCLIEMIDGHIYLARYSGKLWSFADGYPVGKNENGDIMYSSWCSIDPTYEVRRWCYVHDLFLESEQK